MIKVLLAGELQNENRNLKAFKGRPACICQEVIKWILSDFLRSWLRSVGSELTIIVDVSFQKETRETTLQKTRRWLNSSQTQQRKNSKSIVCSKECGRRNIIRSTWAEEIFTRIVDFNAVITNFYVNYTSQKGLWYFLPNNTKIISMDLSTWHCSFKF